MFGNQDSAACLTEQSWDTSLNPIHYRNEETRLLLLPPVHFGDRCPGPPPPFFLRREGPEKKEKKKQSYTRTTQLMINISFASQKTSPKRQHSVTKLAKRESTVITRQVPWCGYTPMQILRALCMKTQRTACKNPVTATVHGKRLARPYDMIGYVWSYLKWTIRYLVLFL
jgi:hypothetical protein